MKKLIQIFAILFFVSTLAACMTTYNPVPQGYQGETKYPVKTVTQIYLDVSLRYNLNTNYYISLQTLFYPHRFSDLRNSFEKIQTAAY